MPPSVNDDSVLTHTRAMSWLFVCLNKSHPITWELCVKYIITRSVCQQILGAGGVPY